MFYSNNFFRTLSQHRYQNERQPVVLRRNDLDDNLLITLSKEKYILLIV